MARTRPCMKCGHPNAVDAVECEKCAVVFKDIRGKERAHHIPDSCEYTTATQERCRYPATMSPSTNGSGPWFCRFHFFARGTAMADHMVEASRDYAPATWDVAAEELELRAREVAVRFGVDPSLPPKQRCLAVMRAWEAKKQERAA